MFAPPCLSQLSLLFLFHWYIFLAPTLCHVYSLQFLFLILAFSLLWTTISTKALDSTIVVSSSLCSQQELLIQKIQTLMLLSLMVWLHQSFSWTDNVSMSIRWYLSASSFFSSNDKCHFWQNGKDYFVLWTLWKNHTNHHTSTKMMISKRAHYGWIWL